MNNITLVNVTSEGGVLFPAIVRCNETNPCKNFYWQDVNVKSLFSDITGYAYDTEYVYGESVDSYPNPGFMDENGNVAFEYAVPKMFMDQAKAMLAAMPAPDPYYVEFMKYLSEYVDSEQFEYAIASE
jgi:hypothetical protein